MVSGRGNLRIDVCEGEQRAWSSLASSPDRIKIELFGLLMIADGHTEPGVISKDMWCWRCTNRRFGNFNFGVRHHNGIDHRYRMGFFCFAEGRKCASM